MPQMSNSIVNPLLICHPVRRLLPCLVWIDLLYTLQPHYDQLCTGQLAQEFT